MSLDVTDSKTAELCCACCRTYYYKAALVIWPRKERTKTICEQGVDAALKQLAQMAAAAGGSKGGDDARELAKAIWDKFGLNGTGVEFVCSVQMLGMQELALQIRYRYQASKTTDCTDLQTWLDEAEHPACAGSGLCCDVLMWSLDVMLCCLVCVVMW